MSRYRINHLAAIEIAEIVARIAKDSPGQATKVYSAILSAIGRLSKNPKMARSYGPSGVYRRWNGSGKIRNYFIYYEIEESGIHILHVIHAARNQEATLTDLEEE